MVSLPQIPPAPITLLFPRFPSACSVRHYQWSSRALPPETTLRTYYIYTLSLQNSPTSFPIHLYTALESLLEKLTGNNIFVSLLYLFHFHLGFISTISAIQQCIRFQNINKVIRSVNKHTKYTML